MMDAAVAERLRSLGEKGAAGGRPRERTPIVLKGIKSSVPDVIPAARLSALRIDESYQRMRVEGISNDIEYVLREGGDVPAPVHLVRRKDRSLWIVDGQQRFWGHLAAEKDMKVIIHSVEEYEVEKDLFIALNASVQVSPGLIVHAWPGPSAGLILRANEDKDHPLYQRVNFGIRGKVHSVAYHAVGLVFGMLAATGTKAGGNVQRALQYADARCASGQLRARMEEFLRTVPAVFSHKSPRRLLVGWLGEHCAKVWEGGIVKIGAKHEAALSRVVWEDVAPATTHKFKPLYKGTFEKHWPSSR